MATAKTRAVRVPDPLWSKAITRARNEGTTVAELINAWLADYVIGDDKTITDDINVVMERLRRIRMRLMIGEPK